jgi:hypothetical protein
MVLEEPGFSRNDRVLPSLLLVSIVDDCNFHSFVEGRRFRQRSVRESAAIAIVEALLKEGAQGKRRRCSALMYITSFNNLKSYPLCDATA